MQMGFYVAEKRQDASSECQSGCSAKDPFFLDQPLPFALRLMAFL
jgi:hypothetical protein